MHVQIGTIDRHARTMPTIRVAPKCGENKAHITREDDEHARMSSKKRASQLHSSTNIEQRVV